MVDLYYQIQEFRKAAKNQVRAGDEAAEPNFLIEWLGDEFGAIESMIKKSMDVYTDEHAVGRWAKSIFGVGPVLAGGFLASIDITRAPTAGSIWRYAGVDPTIEFLGKKKAAELVGEILGKSKKVTDEHLAKIAGRVGRTADKLRGMASDETGKVTRTSLTKALAKRPWNGRLKVLTWKFADCVKKHSGNDKCFYGKLYQQYKADLIARNERLEFRVAAEEGARRVGRHTEAYKHYTEGKLPPGHLDARAMRWVGKLFLSHYHAIAYEAHYGEPPPKPYAIAILGHKDMIEIPNYPF